VTSVAIGADDARTLPDYAPIPRSALGPALHEPDRRRGDHGGAQRSARTSGRRRARWSVLAQVRIVRVRPHGSPREKACVLRSNGPLSRGAARVSEFNAAVLGISVDGVWCHLR
jgi:hypothetical protein